MSLAAWILHFPLPLIRVPGCPVRGFARVARIRRSEHARRALRLIFSRAPLDFAQKIDFWFKPGGKDSFFGLVSYAWTRCFSSADCSVVVLAYVRFLDSAYSSCVLLLLVAASTRCLSPASIFFCAVL
jgi:hypothetical protein